MYRRILLLSLLLTLTPRLASATTFTYSYTGPLYSELGNGFGPNAYTPGERLFMTIELAAPVLAIHSTKVNPLYWRVSDGVAEYSSITCQAVSCSASFSFEGDGTTGALTGWVISADVFNYTPNIAHSHLLTYGGCALPPCGDQVDFVSIEATVPFRGSPWQGTARATHNTNAILANWTLTVPEGNSLLLLLVAVPVGVWLNRKGLCGVSSSRRGREYSAIGEAGSR